MREQDTTLSGQTDGRGIVVPLGLDGLRVLSQCVGTAGGVEVTVIGTRTRARCPRCGRISAKQHDVRSRPKRDVAVGGYRVVLVLRKRRFRCLTCRRAFTEPDTACGWRRRTTARLREQIGQQALGRPLCQVAAEEGVGPRFVQDGLGRRRCARSSWRTAARWTRPRRCPPPASWGWTSSRGAKGSATTPSCATWGS